jgi:hypothetical protein
MKYSLLFALLLVICISCENEENEEKVYLKGTWIETTSHSDTLLCKKETAEGFFILNREKEERNGHILPKAGAGIYNYSLRGDSIDLVYSLSGSSEENTYYFRLDTIHGRITIGNFYEDSLAPGHKLSFARR